MRLTKTSLLVTLSVFSLLAQVPVQAQPPGQGRGHGHGRGAGGGGGGGPLPAKDRETIHDLFASHDSIKREVTLTRKGYKAVTTSDDPKIVSKLQEHIAAMEKRLEAGFPVRRWDPAFEEFFQHYDQLTTKIRRIDNGVIVVVRGKTPEAIKVARNHAKIISGFVEKGEDQHHAKHPTAIAPAGDEAKPAKGGEGCENCKESCQCGKAGKQAPPRPADE